MIFLHLHKSKNALKAIFKWLKEINIKSTQLEEKATYIKLHTGKQSKTIASNITELTIYLKAERL